MRDARMAFLIREGRRDALARLGRLLVDTDDSDMRRSGLQQTFRNALKVTGFKYSDYYNWKAIKEVMKDVDYQTLEYDRGARCFRLSTEDGIKGGE
ncbi:hypothetical protein N9B94_01015 [Verrucomicrobia bacterium]|nr:hypothetical protein [Verrucomicrobiota bacterium]